MHVCTQCGHELGVGRFCVNCGHPVGAPPDDSYGRTDTAERPAVLAVTPRTRRTDRRRLTWWPWLVGAVVMVLVAVLGWTLMFGGDEETTRTVLEVETTAPDPEPTASERASESPTPSPEPAPPLEPADLARQAIATVPATAPPSTDYSGNQVRYDARQMLDGVPETAWRMADDGTGQTIVVTLPEASTLTSVGLVNGYAKTAIDAAGNELDWYAGNRRVLAVEWSFDDGTTLTQDLGETRDLQRLDLDGVTTSTISLTLVEVSAPGPGPSSRDFTAISEIALVGSPA